ncbi:MAG: twin-arginine translocation signal domain-containing protein, partial [Phycisphaerae bacterium]|nr:twin-arginine translocation signal domain-containing protein [Phycisphaerae bacterium]
MNNIRRREFLKGVSVAAAGIAGLPTIIPSSAFGAGGAAPPSERIVMGCIGVGGQGTGNMRAFLGRKDVQVISVCDVDANHRRRAAKHV